MSGKRTSAKIPALIDREKVVVTNTGKAEVLGRAFAAVRSGDNLSDVHKQQKARALRENEDVKEKREDGYRVTDVKAVMVV
ncbi:hypothetical protein UPYG_G00261640 [Umbra pygmaea]|uniref:Uncharacterized protein n=1 Tax=Umbra pygmaea TaxID=75934 RepID=A0ABD0WA23_UMBPY